MNDDPRSLPVKSDESQPEIRLTAETLREAVVAALRELERSEPRDAQLVASFSERIHLGPMPPVELAAGYEAAQPGSIDRMFSMAERDQQAFIESRTDKNRRDDDYRTRALFAGLAALILIIAGTIGLALTGHDWVAGSLATIGAAGVVTAFVNARFGTTRRPEPKPPPEEPDE